MGLSEEYTNNRLDRLAGDIRDEAASRREDNSESRAALGRALLVVGAALVLVIGVRADHADAAPLMGSSNARHWEAASTVLREVRTEQRFEDLNRKIDEGTSQAVEDLRKLRSHMEAGIEELDDDSRKRDGLLFYWAGVVLIFCLTAAWIRT